MREDQLFDLFKQPESEWLDFKERFPVNMCELVHDILCLANSLHDGPRHLVFGVSDDRKVQGVENDEGRKTQAQVLDVLRNSALNIMPTVAIKTVQTDGHSVDVLTIQNRPEKPYFLLRDKVFQGVTIRAGVCYARIGDTNTSVNGCVDDKKLERLYRERFGLDKSALDRLRGLLSDPSAWTYVEEGNHVFFFHSHFPEFRIEFRERADSEFSESWANDFLDPKASSDLVVALYHSTAIFQSVAVYCDGARCVSLVPNQKVHPLNGYGSNQFRFYYYFIRGSSKWLVNEMIKARYPTHQAEDMTARFPTMMTFDSEEEVETIISQDITQQESSLPCYETDPANRGKYLRRNC